MKSREYTTDANYTYTCLTHTHRPVKAGTTWLCLSWKLRFCMEHMSTSFYYRLRTDYPSPIPVLSTKCRPSSKLFLNPCRFPLRVQDLSIPSFFLFPWRLQSRACIHTLYIYSIFLYLSISNFFIASTISRACNGGSLLRMMCIIYYDDNS